MFKRLSTKNGFLSSLRLFSTTRSKLVSVEEAVSKVKRGSHVLSGGFGACGVPNLLIKEIAKQKIDHLHVVTSISSLEDWGVSILLGHNLLDKLTMSYTGNNKQVVDQYFKGELSLDLIP